MNKNKTDPNYKIIAENRRARFDYSIEDEIECGLSLAGSEVKSLRQNLRILVSATQRLKMVNYG